MHRCNIIRERRLNVHGMRRAAIYTPTLKTEVLEAYEKGHPKIGLTLDAFCILKFMSSLFALPLMAVFILLSCLQVLWMPLLWKLPLSRLLQ